MRALRGFAALVFIVLVVAGGPVVLFQVGRMPDLAGGLGAMLTRPDNGTLLLALLTLVGWVAWGAFTISVAVEAYAAASGHRVRLPGLGATQSFAGGLVVAVSALLAAQAGASQAAAQPVAVAATPAASSVADGDARPAQTLRAQAVHVVRMGDDLWSIAKAHYGDGSQWKRIADANAELIDDPHRIEAGWQLVLPGLDPQAAPEAPKQQVASIRLADAVSLAADAAAGPLNGGRPGAPAPEVPTVEVPNVLPGPEGADHPDGPAVILGSTVGGLLAGCLAGLLHRSLVIREAQRPLGRRFVKATDDQVVAALARLGGDVGGRALGPALRAVAGAASDRLPRLVGLAVGESLRVVLDRPVTPPPGWRQEGTTLEAPREALLPLAAQPATDAVNPWGAVVSAGFGPQGMEAVDLEQIGLLSLRGDPATVAGLLNALVIELTSAPWADGVHVVAVGGDAEFMDVLDSPVLVHCLDVESALRMAEARFDDRPASVTDHDRDLRRHVDQVEAWGPQVLVLDAAISHDEAARVLALAKRGLAVVTTNDLGARWDVRAAPEVSTLPDGRRVIAQSLPRATRDAVVAALRASRATETEPAPWWAGHSRTTPLPAGTADRKESAPVDDNPPTLLLVGPTDLLATRGPRPSRAVKQCVEYAAWLLEHPGATSTQMAHALLVAESTRRSNMSRLRTWLGADEAGQPYLPEAYSGRIQLHPAVTSDWDALRLHLIAGVGRTSETGLVNALHLVRGAPLADAAPGQWHWAEELRFEIAAVVRDVGVRLAGLALDRGDIDLARWATARALTAAPEDELLLCARVRTEALAGNRAEVQRLAMRLGALSRRLGIELSDETVALLQEALEGRVRARDVVA